MTRWTRMILVVVLGVGCSTEVGDRLLAPNAPSMAKGGNGGRNDGDNLVVDVVAGDFAGDNLVLSTCAGDSESGYNIWFGNTDQGTNGGCLVITTSEGITLVDDIYFTIGARSGSSTKVTFWGHDAAGSESILHQSDPMPVDPPTLLAAQGFTIHVHATDVPVWRLNRHNSSKKVARVGTVDVGDLVYRLP